LCIWCTWFVWCLRWVLCVCYVWVHMIHMIHTLHIFWYILFIWCMCIRDMCAYGVYGAYEICDDLELSSKHEFKHMQMWSIYIYIYNARVKDSVKSHAKDFFCLYIWCNYNTLLYLERTYGVLIKMHNLGDIRISHSRLAHLTYMAFHM
jgi:hypothetical protein